MAMKTLERADLDLARSRRTLILIWQNPKSRRFVKVGQVDSLPDGHVAFQYLDSAWDDPDFVPLLEYPDLEAGYVSNELPAFFANRVLSTGRSGYTRYLGWLGLDHLDPQDVPFEVLARTGGGRATDTFHVVDLPVDRERSFSSRFFVSGIRYAGDADQVLSSMREGDQLCLELEEENPANPEAVLIKTVDGRKVGYVPDWLCSPVRERIVESWNVAAVAERVNPEAPAHVRVLCRVDAEPN
mgnify:FL=1